MLDANPSLDHAGRMSAARSKILAKMALGDRSFHLVTRLCAYGVFILLAGIMLSLILGAWPAIETFGLEFLVTRRWAPQLDEPILGALAPI
ncbi:MAG: phosphate ABC transporter permease PstC, partial [Alphaproteobacteria bacterium]|nr:phosphate ABC transporter permease PstC [Alphaproteobacteria bacterium]